MDIERMREFIELGRYRSFTQAAKILHMAQPTLSGHIAALEKELGVPLLTRSGGTVEFTPAGTVFFKKAQGLVSGFDEMVVDCRKANKVSAKYKLIDLISMYGYAQFISRAVDVWEQSGRGSIETSFCSIGHSTVEAALAAGVIDVGFFTAAHGEEPVMGPDPRKYGYFKLGTETLKPCVPPDSPWLQQPSLTVADLQDIDVPTSDLPVFDSLVHAFDVGARARGIGFTMKRFAAESHLDQLPHDARIVYFLADYYRQLYGGIWGISLVPLAIEGADILIDHYAVCSIDAPSLLLEFLDEVDNLAS